MKILFLDFDGVLNSSQWAHKQHRDWKLNKTNPRPYGEQFCFLACSNILYAVEQVPDLKIVVSSSWRLGTPVEDLRRVLSDNGIPSDLVIDKTPVHPGGYRGGEIKEWLDKTGLDIEAFAIVDDDSDMEPLMKYFVQTNSHHGLMWEDTQKIISILKGEEPFDGRDNLE